MNGMMRSLDPSCGEAGPHGRQVGCNQVGPHFLCILQMVGSSSIRRHCEWARV